MKTKLNIFLAKADKPLNSLIKSIDDDNLLNIEVTNGTFYYKQVDAKIPAWIDSFFGNELGDVDLASKTIQAVYVTEVAIDSETNRFFAITFGLGRNILNLDNFEEDFGLTTTLNLVDTNDLRSVDTNSLGNGAMKHFIQIGHSSSLRDFGIDLEKDLVKNISGKVSDSEMLANAKSITGKQSVTLSSDIDIHDIDEFLLVLYQYYQRDDYRNRFPGMNNATKIKDKVKQEELDNTMLRTFNGLAPECNIELLLPDLKLNHEIGAFKYGSSDETFSELEIDDLKRTLLSMFRDGQITIAKLKNNHIRMLSEEGIQTGKWSIYKCLSVDMQQGDRQYVLNEGQWYSFDMDYVNNVNEFFEGIELSDIDMQEYQKEVNSAETENNYNDRICNDCQQFEKMDCNCVHPFNQTSIEVCDIFDKESRAFIHVKHYTSSSVMSHLFAQGTVSAELLLTPTLRNQILDRKPSLADCIFIDDFKASSYKIVYAIIDKNKGSRNRYPGDRPHLPFFSKISLRQAVQRLQGFGYTVMLKRIRWNQ